ncbi:MAG: cytochrome P450 [Myxococcales bacterium]|nr:cytochrome P450 [Myxococcales bacterium]
MGQLMEYFGAALAERRRRPRDDIMTLLTQAEIPGVAERLSDEELTRFFILLATAGNETVTKLLATLFGLLAEHPDQRHLLLERPDRIPGAVEETLRFDPPSQYQGRVTTREITVHGRRLPKGARVLVINAASGRDERKYADPERWDVTRRFDLHLNFGHGRHVCLGKSLALLESRVATEELLKRLPHFTVTGSERMHSSNVRGLCSLKIAAGG